MNKEKVLDYVMNSPGNSNRAVLSGMLDGADSGAGLPAVSGEDEGKVLTVVNGEWDKAELDLGYKCTEEVIVLTEETVTTAHASGASGTSFAAGNFSYSQLIDADTITVTFNGTEYEASKVEYQGTNIYGGYASSGPNFSEYPFAIGSAPDSRPDADSSVIVNMLLTENEGTYSVKIGVYGETVETSECFEKARGYSCTEAEATAFDGTVATSISWNGGVRSSDLTFLNDFDFTAPAIDVIFNETEYKNVELHEIYGSKYYGAPYRGGFGDFSNYPFCIIKDVDYGEVIVTKSSGTYNIKINYMSLIINTTESFEAAVKKSNPPLRYIIDGSNESIIEGKINSNYANGHYSHAEGIDTTASGECSHAEGFHTVAEGDNSHAEGSGTTASGDGSHAEGGNTTASGIDSHAEGSYTVANHKAQHVFGELNIADPSTAAADARGTYIEIVGNGTSSSSRSNARTLDWNGNERLAGSLTLGSTTLTEAQLQRLLALLN